jgi:hypothetical protein
MTSPLRTVDFRIVQSYVTLTVQLATAVAELVANPRRQGAKQSAAARYSHSKDRVNTDATSIQIAPLIDEKLRDPITANGAGVAI